ncbi:uncharacterized protein LOC131631491, partial [Vicia villosa]|uniref:uncharacterized protein LOC131631491 n=1 Tax=Vicia villosa TaxID=3911 RepID=UPI00273B710D
MVDFESLLEHGFNVKETMLVQGWSNYFERLIGPVYPHLVMDFWKHATVTPTAIISFVLGHEIVITEKLIRKLYNLDDSEGITCAEPGRVPWEKVDEELSAFKASPNQTTLLKPFYKVWAEIILETFYHRKRAITAKYVSQDHKYALFCIGKGIKVSLSSILFQHLKTNVEESRDAECKKFPEFKKNTIPLARMISDILVESDLMNALRDVDTPKFFTVLQGHVLNALDLKRILLIPEVTSTPRIAPDILTRRSPVENFSQLFKEELHKSVKRYLKTCVLAQSYVDRAWIRGRTLPSLVELKKKEQKKKEKRLKRKASEAESKAAKKPKLSYDPDKVHSKEYREKRIRDSLRALRVASSFE